MRGSRILVLLVILLSILSKSSYGQSAWILWDRQTNTSLEKPGADSNESWELIAAHPSYELCLRAGSDKCQTQVKLWRKVSVEANTEYEKKQPIKKDQSPLFKDPLPIMGVTVIGTDDQCMGYLVYDLGFIAKKQSIHSFECFPETFDPRK